MAEYIKREEAVIVSDYAADENGFDWEFRPADIGKTVFLTREEAEAALEAKP